MDTAERPEKLLSTGTHRSIHSLMHINSAQDHTPSPSASTPAWKYLRKRKCERPGPTSRYLPPRTLHLWRDGRLARTSSPLSP